MNSKSDFCKLKHFAKSSKRQTLLVLFSFNLLALIPDVLFAAQTKSQHATQESVEAQRKAIVNIARQYAEHQWKAEPKHVFHGKDKNGVQVDTPDDSFRKNGFSVEEKNVGIPYKWGGFSSIEDFDNGIRAGKFAGHLPQKGSSASSRFAVGVDCSGYVSRCWDLPQKHSTRSIGNICYELESFDELLPGDIINSFDGHVVLFTGFADAEKKEVEVFEAGGTRVKKSVYPISTLVSKSYKALRYKPLDPRWKHQILAPETFSRAANEQMEFTPDDSGTIEFESLENPLMNSKANDWAMYESGENESTLRSVVLKNEIGITIREHFSKSKKVQQNETSYAAETSLAQSIVDFAGFSQNFGELKLTRSEVVSGQLKIDEQVFEAQRIELDLTTTMLSRSVNYPVVIQAQCIRSDAIPMTGMASAKYLIEIRDGKKLIGKAEFEMNLLKFFAS